MHLQNNNCEEKKFKQEWHWFESPTHLTSIYFTFVYTNFKEIIKMFVHATKPVPYNTAKSQQNMYVKHNSNFSKHVSKLTFFS